jgi:hypothetical protein
VSANQPPPTTHPDANRFNAGYPPAGQTQAFIRSIGGVRGGLGSLESMLPEVAMSGIGGGVVGFAASKNGRGALIGGLALIALTLGWRAFRDPAGVIATGDKVMMGGAAALAGGVAAYLSYTE